MLKKAQILDGTLECLNTGSSKRRIGSIPRIKQDILKAQTNGRFGGSPAEK